MPRCPFCLSEMQALPGRTELEQCGDTHLPAARWACPRCPEVVTVLPVATGWEPDVLPKEALCGAR